MKKLFAFVAMSASLMFSAGAFAQTIDLTYKSAAGVIVNLANAEKIEVVGSSLRVSLAVGNAAVYDLADGTHALYNDIIADPKFLAQYQQVGATTAWVNSKQIGTAQCVGVKTRIVWTSKATNALEDLSDNCATFTALTARTVN